jgi:diamine N-acetyltransferase
MTTNESTPSSDAVVTLREITRETLWPVLQLRVRPDQTQFVADNATSIAEAHFTPTAWFRAIYADDTPVGFVMLDDHPEKPQYFLWRFMVDATHQRKGYGRRAIELLIEHVKTRPGATELLLSYHPGEGSPREFYCKLGFEDTGEIVDEERVMRRGLTSDE